MSTTTTTTAMATTTTTTNGVKPGENGKLGQEKSAYERFATGGSEKKKPEIKAKPKLPKVIPVVKKVREGRCIGKEPSSKHRQIFQHKSCPGLYRSDETKRNSRILSSSKATSQVLI